MSNSPITIDEMLRDLPKLMRVTDDMHRMTNYLGDLRLLSFVLALTSYIGGACFLIFKYMQYKKKCQKKELEKRRTYDYEYTNGDRRYAVSGDLRSVRSEKPPQLQPSDV